MSEIVSVYATFGSDDEARTIGRRMIDERMAACVNILGPCRSIYRWQNAIQEGDEVAAIFKTTDGQAPLLIERITALHSYDVPAATVWPIAQAPQAFRQWIIDNSGR